MPCRTTSCGCEGEAAGGADGWNITLAEGRNISLTDLKPAAPARVQLLLAALMWTVVGSLLAFFGARWVLESELASPWIWLGVAAAVGLSKAFFLLDRTSRKTIDRIRARGDGRCIGGFLSWKSWGFVLLMAAGGRLLRAVLLPKTIVGLIYVAVGTGLLFASRRLWVAWWRHNKNCNAGA